MGDDGDDYLTWFKRESRRWTGPGFIDLAGSAVSGQDVALDELIECGRSLPADMMHGHEGLRDAVARHLGVSCPADGRPARDAVLTTAGASNGIAVALMAIRRLMCRRGAAPRALVESPTYRPLFDVAEYLGFEMSTFRRGPADGHRLRPDAVRDALRDDARPVVLVVSNPHNPTGAEATVDEVAAALAAAPPGSYALVDETFINAGRRRESVARLGDPRIVAIGSLAKDPGLWALRCGWVVSFGETLAEMRLAWVHGFNIGSPLTESAACEALRRLPEFNRRTEPLLAENLVVAEQAMGPLHAAGLISWTPPARGCVIFPELRSVSAQRTFDQRRSGVRRFYARAVDDARVAVVPGDLFNPARQPGAGEASIRIGIGGPTDPLREGLARLAKLITEFSPG